MLVTLRSQRVKRRLYGWKATYHISLEYAFVFPTAEIFLNRATYQKPLVKTVYSCVKPPKRKLRFFCLFFLRDGGGGGGGKGGRGGRKKSWFSIFNGNGGRS